LQKEKSPTIPPKSILNKNIQTEAHIISSPKTAEEEELENPALLFEDPAHEQLLA